MLRASGLAAKRKLELRVVSMPPGTDPADLLQRDGAEAMSAAVTASVPFVRFRVERVLASGDHSSAEGRDRMIDELRPVFAQLSPGAMWDELTKLASGRLAVDPRVFERVLASAGAVNVSGGGDLQVRGEQRQSRREPERPGDGARGASKQLSGREDAERAFLALCIASPDDGAQMLASVDIDEHFSSELLRRAATRLRAGDLREPMGAVPGESARLEDDPELTRLLAELVVEAGRDEAHPAMLEAQRLQLELARVDRQIQRARGEQRGEISGLAGQRAEVKRQFDRAYGRVLEETGERE
jgi:DNA primase